MSLDRIRNFFRDGTLPMLLRPTKLSPGADGDEENGTVMTGARVALPLALAVFLAIAGATVGPRGFDAATLLANQDDPVALADRAVARRLNGEVAEREIAAALAADDADLAASFFELARERKIEIDPALVTRIEAANSAIATASRSVKSFARGLVSGETDDLAGLAGTVASDLLIIGDARDLLREGSRLAAGQPVDDLILAMAWVGPVATAGTYASAGAAAPVRVGLTVVKVARRMGRLSAEMAAWVNQAAVDIVDWAKLRNAVGSASIVRPVAGWRAVRQAVRPDKAQALARLAEDVGNVQAKAGTRAALDGLKLARGPGDLSRVAALAAAKGGKTRAILKLLGRGAIMLTVGVLNLAMWIFWAVATALSFVVSLKRAAERATERYCARRRRRLARAARREAAASSKLSQARAGAARPRAHWPALRSRPSVMERPPSGLAACAAAS